MNKRLSKVLLMAAACTGSFAAQAQQPAGRLNGLATDSVTQQPLPFATVLLKKESDPSFVLSLVTDEKGRFQFDPVADGQYYLSGSYIGYKSTRRHPLTLLAGTTPGPVTVQLVPERTALKEVTVTATKPFVELRNDRIVLNVAQSPLAAGGNAAELLGRAPGVVESNGGYQMRGKSVTVFLDGKAVNLSGADLREMLAAMPSNTLDKVEIITSPSAKYDAQGGVVVNLTTAKSKSFGFNGTASAGVGTGRYARYNTGLNLNYRQPKFNLYGGYDLLRTKQYVLAESQRPLQSESTLNETSTTVTERQSHSAKLGFDYDISKTSSAGVYIKTLVSLRDVAGTTSSALTQPVTGLPPLSLVQSTGNNRFLIPSANLYYRSTAGKPGTELRLSADYFGYDRAVFGDIETQFLAADGTPFAPSSYLRNHSPANNSVKSAAADYVRPLRDATLEAGLKTTFTTTDNDIGWEQRAAGSTWQPDLGKTNHFIYRENINAAYATLNKKFKQTSVTAGLRMEQTNTTGTSLTTSQTTRRSYLNLFPSVSLDYSLNDQQQVNLAYQRRIDRFRLDVVNPFVTYVSQYFYFQGNPNVRPSTSDNFSFTHVYQGALSTTISYSRHQHVLSEVYRLKDASAVLSTFENAARGEAFDLNLSHSKQLLHNRWSTTNTAALSYARIISTAESGLNAATPTAYFVTNNTLTLPKGLKVEVAGNYFLPTRFGAYTFRSHYTTNVAASLGVLHGAGSLTLNVTDVFNTLNSRYRISSYGVTSTNVTKTESRFVRLNFTYKFGNKNVKASKARRLGTEAEQRRLDLN